MEPFFAADRAELHVKAPAESTAIRESSTGLSRHRDMKITMSTNCQHTPEVMTVNDDILATLEVLRVVFEDVKA